MSRLSVVSADKVNSTTEQLMKEFTQRIVANPPGVCPVDMQLAFLKVCHAQTCGKCVPPKMSPTDIIQVDFPKLCEETILEEEENDEDSTD